MMDDITHCIADAQYGMALKDRGGPIKPLAKLNTPTDEQRQQYKRSFTLNLDFILDSPIALYKLEEFAGQDIKQFSEFLLLFDRFKKMEDVPDNAVDQLLTEAKKLPQEYQKSVKEIAESINGFNEYRATPMGRLPSIRVRPLVSFGGLGVHDSLANHEGVIVSAMDVEVIDETTTDLSPEEVALDQKRMAEQIRRSVLREATISVFAELDSVIRMRVRDIVVSFKADSEEYKDMIDALWYSEQKLQVNDFQVFRDLGRGAFGVVSSAKLRSTGALVAIKCVNRRLLKGKKALKLLSVEKKILQKLGENPSHFTIWLKYAFSDKDHYYMALPLCSGGDLGFHLRNRGYFSIDRTRFHIAETLLGIAHLHSLGIIYRDLKPDNIILDEDGHCRISDLGLAVITGGKRIKGRAGTPGYWAPEVIQKQSYTFSADWWSLGVCIYEFIVGICPFSKTYTGMDRDQATLRWQIKFPSAIGSDRQPFPDDARHLILSLLNRDKLQRLGAGEGGAQDIKRHPFFKKIDWWKMAERRVDSRWIPKENLIHAADQSELESANNERDYRKLKLTPADEIKDFDYVSRYAHEMDIVEVLKATKSGDLRIEPLYDTNCCTIL